MLRYFTYIFLGEIKHNQLNESRDPFLLLALICCSQNEFYFTTIQIVTDMKYYKYELLDCMVFTEFHFAVTSIDIEQ